MFNGAMRSVVVVMCLLGAATTWAASGGGNGGPGSFACGPQSCAGCCLHGSCVDGDAVSACGAEGIVCKVCRDSEICSSALCVPDQSGCSAVPAEALLATGALVVWLRRRFSPSR